MSLDVSRLLRSKPSVPLVFLAGDAAPATSAGLNSSGRTMLNQLDRKQAARQQIAGPEVRVAVRKQHPEPGNDHNDARRRQAVASRRGQEPASGGRTAAGGIRIVANGPNNSSSGFTTIPPGPGKTVRRRPALTFGRVSTPEHDNRQDR